MKNKFFVFTAGEPAGIGPDLSVYLAQHEQKVNCVVIADPNVLETRAKSLNLPLKIIRVTAEQLLEESFLNDNTAYSGFGQLLCLAIKVQSEVVCGQLDRNNVNYVLDSIKLAVSLCLDRTFSALITGPIHKGLINQAGFKFSGHTEFLAQLTHTSKVVMMLATEGLRVALATTHLPLNQVSAAITKQSLTEVIGIIDSDLKTKFKIADPLISICGLNPHAGEDGHLGKEEIETITPVIKELKEQGLNLNGPLPADTIFSPHNLKQSDTFLAMYHDQGLPVLKYKGFGKAVNITLGLPFIRTSVDHGTALDLAGTGKINTGSLFYAIKTAQELS